jgi:hypothetical protein
VEHFCRKRMTFVWRLGVVLKRSLDRKKEKNNHRRTNIVTN